MLKKREVETETVEVDGQKFTVSEMTVRRRTRFEQILARRGTESLREAILICCVSDSAGAAVFDPDKFRDQVSEKSEDPEGDALDLLVDDLATWSSEPLQPLIEAGLRVNKFLGNAVSGGSTPN